MIVDPSIVNDLTKLILCKNHYEFTDFYGKHFSTETLINSDIYVYFKEQMHKIKVYNDPYKVVLPIIDPYYVDQIMVSDELLTNGNPIHLKFFLDKCDWGDINRREYFNILEYVKESSETIYNDLLEQARNNIYFSKVFIMEK